MSQKQNHHILNLAQELNQEFIDFMIECGVVFVEKSEAENYKNLDFIIIGHEDEASEVSEFYDIFDNEIELICVTKVLKIKEFLSFNGRLSLNNFENNLYKKSIKRFLGGVGSVHLLDEEFDEGKSGSFHLTNHLHVGEVIDQITLHSFDAGFNIVSIRSYLDHLVYYFTYLKQAGLAGVPIEIEYAFDDGEFVLNTFASVKNFSVEYLLDAFGPVSNDEPMQYLLGVTSRATHFLDIVLFEDVSKLAFTSRWGKGLKPGLSGIAFHQLESSAQVYQKIEKRIKDFETNTKGKDLESKRLPQGLLDALENGKGNSLFKEDPEQANDLLAFIVASYEEHFPEGDVEEIQADQLDKILGKYPNEEFLEKIGDDEKSEILDQLRKKNVLDAYDEEVERVRGKLAEDDDLKNSFKETLNEDVAKKVSGHIDEDSLKKLLSGSSEDDFMKKVKGLDEQDSFKKIVKGLKKEDKGAFVQRFSSSIKENSSQFDFSKTKLGSKDFKKKAKKLSLQSLGQLSEESADLKRVKAFLEKSNFHEKMSDDFSLKVEAGEMEQSQFSEFVESEVSNLIEATLADTEQVSDYSDKEKEELTKQYEFEKNFKDSFEKQLASAEENQDEILKSENGELGEAAQKLIKSSIKEALDKDIDFKSATREEIEEKELQIISRLSDAFDKDAEDVKTIIKDSTDKVKNDEVQTVVQELFKEGEVDEKKGKSLEDTALLQKLTEAESKNKHLSNEIKKLELKLESIETTASKVEEMDRLAQEAMEEEIAEEREASKHLSVADKSKLLDDLKSGEPLTDDQVHAITSVIEREKNVIEKVKEVESSMKKLSIENSKKETLFKSELNKANKALKAKDMVIVKAKEGMTRLAEKKDRELSNAKHTIEELNKKIKSDDSARLSFELKKMTRNNESLEKSVLIHKKKIETLAKTISSQKSSGGGDSLAEDNRKLKNQSMQFEAKLTAMEKVKNALDQKYQTARDGEIKATSELKETQVEVKRLNLEIEKIKADSGKSAEEVAQEAELKSQAVRAEKELETVKAQNEQLQIKLKEVVEKMAKAGSGAKANGNQSANEQRLEKSVKTMSQELTKVKNEAAEQKKELKKTENELRGLKNKNNLLQKELDRFKNKKSAA